MILLDDRGGATGRADVEHYPGKLHALMPNSMLTRLDSGDVAFEGAGGVTVGVELKKVMDAVNCMYTGRLADTQIPLMKASYDICYLLIEGVYRPCPRSGVLQYLRLFEENERGVQCGKWIDASSGRQRLMYTAFESWLSTLTIQGGMLVKLSPSTEATASTLMALWNWWSQLQHRSYHVLSSPAESAELSRPSMLRRMLALLPGVGWTRSGILAKRFHGVEFHPNGDLLESWLIKNQIAEATAKKIVAACLGGRDEH